MDIQKQFFDGEHFSTVFCFTEFMCFDQFSMCWCWSILCPLSLMFLIFFVETIIPPSDLDNDIQGVVTIPLAGPDLVG